MKQNHRKGPPAELFKAMAEQVRDYGVFLLDPTGHVMSWGVGARRLKGYKAEEVIGKHFSIFYPPEAIARNWPQEELVRASREGRFEDEGHRIRKDGSRFWANVVITALRDHDGKLIAFSKITRDLTERREHEDELRRSEERFRLLVEGVRDYAIYMLDPTGVVTSWNGGAERIKGYRREEIIGRHFSNFFTDEDVNAGKPWQELNIARRDGKVEAEGWRVRKNGERFWARVVVTPLFDATGELHGFAKVTQDLSAQRQILELEATARKVNEFIAMLAHEIRNPLAPIQSAVAMMHKNISAAPEMRDVIERQAARLARIADDMIDITRVTRGELKIEHAAVRPHDIVARAVEAARPYIEAAAHVLEVDVADNLPAVDGDLDRLVQVFSNLLNNSARYTPAGGRIWMSASARGAEVVFTVRDTGRGISADELPRIFQMFVQGRSALPRVGQGLGVGLALARSIVELHHGAIEASSEGEGKGSEFVVRLPRRAGTAVEPALRVEKRTPEPPIAPRRILLVDDNEDAAVTLQMLLKTLGHEVRVAQDGPGAIAAFEEFKPHVVLLDIGLPGMSGYDVARQIRTRRGNVQIVAITGWGHADDRQRSAEAGIDVHLVKPIDENELMAAIARPSPRAPNGTVH